MLFNTISIYKKFILSEYFFIIITSIKYSIDLAITKKQHVIWNKIFLSDYNIQKMTILN